MKDNDEKGSCDCRGNPLKKVILIWHLNWLTFAHVRSSICGRFNYFDSRLMFIAYTERQRSMSLIR